MQLFYSLKITTFVALVWGATLLLSHDSSAQADGQTQPPTVIRLNSTPASLPPVDVHKALQLILTRDACSLPLDLKADSAPVEELAPRVQKKIVASPNPAIKRLRVEVRSVHPIRLTFDAKGSTVGGVLNSIAFLSSSQLWIFPDYLLIAPQEALTVEEQETNKIGLQSPEGATGRLPSQVIAAFTKFIGGEIKGLPNSTTAKPSFSGISLPSGKNLGGAAFDQLSPDAQAMLQALVQSSNATTFNGTFSLEHYAGLQLNSDAFVSITNGYSDGGLSVQVPQISTPSIFQLQWSFDGNGSGASAGGGAPPPKHQTPRTPPSLVDPSAGKSE